jgi:hypothetical protein
MMQIAYKIIKISLYVKHKIKNCIKVGCDTSTNSGNNAAKKTITLGLFEDNKKHSFIVSLH